MEINHKLKKQAKLVLLDGLTIKWELYALSNIAPNQQQRINDTREMGKLFS